MNEVVLIGRLTKDPEQSYTQSNTAMCTFTLAVNRIQNGEKSADFIRIVAWGKQAEHCGRYLHKGSQCAVNGSIKTGSYKNREGVTVYTTDVWANRVEFLGSSENLRSDERKTNERKTTPFESFDDIQREFERQLPDTFQAADNDIPF